MNKKRVIQLIDTLHIGGAERMAVNVANSLALLGDTFLCVTRADGQLKNQLSKEINYLFLKKTAALDIQALFNFKRYIKAHNIDIIHAHGTSFFFATLIKLIYPSIAIVWHDHNGKRLQTSFTKRLLLKWCSLFFCHIITVNRELKEWSITHLYCSKVSQINNFVVKEDSHKETTLYGTLGKRIICLANLREEKDHVNLINAFSQLKRKGWTLHLVGDDKFDAYSMRLKQLIQENTLEDEVYIYGAKNDVAAILRQGDIGVLSSSSEALPLALLEYGFYELAVIATDVGECSEVIKEHGILVPVKAPAELAQGLQSLIDHSSDRIRYARAFRKHISDNFSDTAIIKSILALYKTC